MGLLFVIHLLGPPLGIGTTSAIFRLSGKCPSSIHRLKTVAKAFDIISEAIFKNNNDGHVDGILFLTSKFWIIFLISFAVIGVKNMES